MCQGFVFDDDVFQNEFQYCQVFNFDDDVKIIFNSVDKILVLIGYDFLVIDFWICNDLLGHLNNIVVVLNFGLDRVSILLGICYWALIFDQDFLGSLNRSIKSSVAQAEDQAVGREAFREQSTLIVSFLCFLSL